MAYPLSLVLVRHEVDARASDPVWDVLFQEAGHFHVGLGEEQSPALLGGSGPCVVEPEVMQV